MPNLKRWIQVVRPWFSQAWVQWTIATVFFLLLSFLYMGHAITDCSTYSTALNSDSTAGFGWSQWASGNSLHWGHTDKADYPLGENLGNPLSIVSTELIFIYKLLSFFTTPICGINLVILLAYTSSALMMFGLVRWLFKRFDIALFAGYAAGFVPYHQLKAQSHLNFVFGTTFIALIWAYLWFLNKPSYRRAVFMALVGAIGYYFDGYFILITSVLIAGLFLSGFLLDLLRVLLHRKDYRQVISLAGTRAKYLLVSALLLGILTLPILQVERSQKSYLNQAFAATRSDLKGETVRYAARPIEFILPALDNPLMPPSYQGWRLSDKNQHGSNFSEDTLFVGYTVLILAVVGLVYSTRSKFRRLRINKIPLSYFIATILVPLVLLFLFSMPSKFSFLGHPAYMPARILIKLTSTWRVMARLFLAMDPLVIILASLGLFFITRNWHKSRQLLFVFICLGILFIEYLPNSFNPGGDLVKDSPKIYMQIKNDPSVKTVAELPMTDLRYSPTIFTFQQLHGKKLLNATDPVIQRGPFSSSIAGLDDRQTLGTLKALHIDVVTSYAIKPTNLAGLIQYAPVSIDPKKSIPDIYSYRISDSESPNDSVLMADKGFDYFSVDSHLISHRVLVNQGDLTIRNLTNSTGDSYDIGFDAQALCGGKSAHLKINQSNKLVWEGDIGNSLIPINLRVNKSAINLNSSCLVDITNMHSQMATD